MSIDARDMWHAMDDRRCELVLDERYVAGQGGAGWVGQGGSK